MNVAEFFAGIGLAGLGLSSAGLKVTWSNDLSISKFTMFSTNSAEAENYVVADVGSLRADQLPTGTQLAWASFPCTDLSSAGQRKGIYQGESSAFWSFLKVLERMADTKPRIVAIENVPGLALHRDGSDLEAAILGLNELGYSVDILEIDARRFVPQSRVRIFLVACLEIQQVSEAPHELRPPYLDKFFNSTRLTTHRALLSPSPDLLESGLTDLICSLDHSDNEWWSEERIEKFEESLSATNLARLSDLQARDQVLYRTAYRRMRDSVPRWEIAVSDVAGCLRTASGGSSRQAVLEIDGHNLRIRWMSPREYAALMGAPEFNFQGISNTQVLNGFGDGVCVPVVSWLAENYLLPWGHKLTANNIESAA